MGANTPRPPASAPIELHFPDTTLVKPQFELELRSFPDNVFARGLLEAIANGVNIGYTGPHNRNTSSNLKSADEHPNVVDMELTKECNKGHIAGPYNDPPFPDLHCSGLGVVAKKNGGWRMIMHLSAPPGRSINDFIPKDDFTLSYTSVDDAVSLVKQLGPQSIMAKIDLKSAFRMCPVRKEDWHLLGMRWRDKYYIDKRLPFGLRSGPYIFNTFASTIEWILKNNYNMEYIIHYLDDYFIAGPPDLPTCRQAVNTMLTVCKELGVPFAMEKLEGPAASITFLGIMINTANMTLSLPPEKLAELLEELERWRGQKKCTKRQLPSLIGRLSFAAKVIPAGRLFFRRLIVLSTTAKQLHHHISLNQQAKADIAWWLKILPTWNGRASMLEPGWVKAPDLELFTDASGEIGYGAYFRGAWFSGTWEDRKSFAKGKSIEWKELYAIMLAAATWSDKWAGLRIKFHCDNLSVVHMWANKSSKRSDIMSLMRTLFYIAASGNFHVSVVHNPGVNNCLADALSRLQFERFRRLAPDADQDPTTTPSLDWCN